MKKLMIFVFGVMLMLAYGCSSDDAEKAKVTEQPITEDAAQVTTEAEHEAAEDTEKAAN